MNNKITASVLAVTLAAGSLSAFEGGGFKECSKKSHSPHQKEYMMQHKKQGFASVMRALSQLDLSSDQWIKIKQSILDMKKQNLENRTDKELKTYFGKSGFDKEGYIKDKSAFMQSKLKNEAQTIDKITGILTQDQTEQLQQKMEQPYRYFGKRNKKKCDR